MNLESLKKILESVQDGSTDIDTALGILKQLPFEDLGFAKVDHHRNLRNGYPEVIYSEGKTIEQIKEIVLRLIDKNNNIMATRASKEVYQAINEIVEECVYYEEARIVVIKKREYKLSNKIITVVSAGTSDMSVAEEAAITAEVMGNKVERLYDVGVAGIHRLLSRLEILNRGNVIIVVAGMEGALASVVGGLVDKPVIAVPTSVGYGANFSGVSALLTMLNSCASGVGVVNIDNGFGAGYLASMINKL